MRETTLGHAFSIHTKDGSERSDAPQDTRKMSSSFYAVCSALFGAIALLGLFLGFFMRGSVGALIAGGEPILRGSFLGVLVEVFRGSIPLPPLGGNTLETLLPVFLYFMMYALAFAVLCSLALAVLSVLLRRAAKSLCVWNGRLVLIVYGTICVSSLLLGALREEVYIWRQLDLPSLFTCLLSLCVLTVMTVDRCGVRGILQVALLLFTATNVCAFIFPKTALLADLNELGTGTLGRARQLTAGLYCIVLTANLLLSLLRLGHERGAAGDIVRFGALLISALALSAAHLSGDGTLEEFVLDQFLAVLFLLLSPLAALLLSALMCTFRPKRLKASPSAQLSAETPVESSLETPAESSMESSLETPAESSMESPTDLSSESSMESPTDLSSEAALTSSENDR